MRLLLKAIFSAIFVWMVSMTTYLSLHKPLWQAGSEFSWASSPWAVATLFDAYFGFLTFFVWVCFKERGLAAKVLWFVLIMAREYRDVRLRAHSAVQIEAGGATFQLAAQERVMTRGLFTIEIA